MVEPEDWREIDRMRLKTSFVVVVGGSMSVVAKLMGQSIAKNVVAAVVVAVGQLA